MITRKAPIKAPFFFKSLIKVTHHGNDFKHPLGANSSASYELEEKLQEFKDTVKSPKQKKWKGLFPLDPVA